MTDRAPVKRLDLAAIEQTLLRLQSEFPLINPQLRDRRDPLDPEVVENLMTGYAYVDELVAGAVDIFALGDLKHLLELNCRVLCGIDRAVRQESAEHLQAVEEHFYNAPGAGIRTIVEWLEAHHRESVWRRAAGVYVRILSEPQLFIEGNHRSGALIVSYLLARDGQPPFVLTPENAQDFFDPSSLIKKIDKRDFVSTFRMPHLKGRFARFLKQQSDGAYLIN